MAGRYVSQRQTAIPPDQWPPLACAAETTNLRAVARQYGVSHAAVRDALRADGRADLLADLNRRRRLEAAAPPPPPPAA
jgi:hypothetical protein